MVPLHILTGFVLGTCSWVNIVKILQQRMRLDDFLNNALYIAFLFQERHAKKKNLHRSYARARYMQKVFACIAVYIKD